jgi:arylsulfatase A-like enzyme
MQPLNIVHIISHDLGRHLGCYGAAVRTPNCDRIAAAGARFTKYFCTAPVCSPSRASLMTGLYPQRHGILGLAHNGWGYRPGVGTLVHHLADAGYQTHLFGGHHEAPVDYRDAAARQAGARSLGYQYLHDTAPGLIADPPWNYIGACHDLLAAAIDGIIAARRPFFINIGTPGAHRPFRDVRGTNRYQDDGRPGIAFVPTPSSQVEVPPYVRDCEGVRSDLGYLNAFAQREDDYIGLIFDLLASRGRLHDTLFVLTTDHGVAMPRAKGMCYDPGIGTYLIMHLPGLVPAGTVVGELLSNIDLMPTYLEAAGVPVPAGIDGRSFLPLVAGHGSYSPRRQVFSEMDWEIGANPIRCIRTAQHKYIRNYGILPRVALTADVYAGRAGEAMHTDCYYFTRDQEELYDLAADPWEQRNLLRDVRHHPERERLAGLLDDWMAANQDALLAGGRLPTTPQQEAVRIGRSPYFCGTHSGCPER